MNESRPSTLGGKRILIVEDEYALASELAQYFERQGAIVAGPVGTVKSALALVAREGPRLDAAILDINLRNDRVYPVADKLIALGVPIVFATGYDQLLMSQSYSNFPRCQKPVDKALLAGVIAAAIANGPGLAG